MEFKEDGSFFRFFLFVKFNFDATVDVYKGFIGMGCVVRDEWGKVFLATANLIERRWFFEWAEVWVSMEVFYVISFYEFKSVQVEDDF